MNRVSKFGNQINNHQTLFICGAFILTLPSPDFENKEGLQYTRVNRRTRGGDLVIHRVAYWPKSKTFTLVWNSLSRLQRDNVILFLRNTLGQKITLNDHENRSFVGVITSPDSGATENGIDKSAITIEFETE